MDEPVVNFQHVLTHWRLRGFGWSHNAFKDLQDPEYDEFFVSTLYTPAYRQIVNAFNLFLRIPEDDIDRLRAFFTEHETSLYGYEIKVTEQMRSLFPHCCTEDATSTNSMGFSVTFDLLDLRINNTAIMGIQRRLLAASSIYLDASTTLYSYPMLEIGQSGGSMLAEFDRVVQQCCAAVRKPLAYLQRGVVPPLHMHRALIYFDVGHPGALQWWCMLLFREIWARLTLDGLNRIRYGPKPQDVYHQLPYLTCHDSMIAGDTAVGDLSCVFDDIYFPGAGITLRFRRSEDTSGLLIWSEIDEREMCAALIHTITAKVISSKTGIAEQVCRQFWLARRPD